MGEEKFTHFQENLTQGEQLLVNSEFRHFFDFKKENLTPENLENFGKNGKNWKSLISQMEEFTSLLSQKSGLEILGVDFLILDKNLGNFEDALKIALKAQKITLVTKGENSLEYARILENIGSNCI